MHTMYSYKLLVALPYFMLIGMCDIFILLNYLNDISLVGIKAPMCETQFDLDIHHWTVD